MRGKTLVQRIGQLLQLEEGDCQGDVAPHQLVQLVGGEGGDDPAKVALLAQLHEQLLEQLPQLGPVVYLLLQGEGEEEEQGVGADLSHPAGGDEGV